MFLKQKEDFNSEKYKADLDALNEVDSQINFVSSHISGLDIRKTLILESKHGLENNVSTADAEEIKALYEKAGAFVPKLQKTFEDVVQFHNRMIQEKIKFITEDLPTLEQDLLHSQKKLSLLLDKKTTILNKLRTVG